MPEISFVLRWPDGAVTACYSPSMIVTEYFEAGRTYDLDDFLGRSREALTIASERVRAKYGFTCSRAEAQLAAIEMRVAGFAAQRSAPAAEPGVTVESFVPI